MRETTRRAYRVRPLKWKRESASGLDGFWWEYVCVTVVGKFIICPAGDKWMMEFENEYHFDDGTYPTVEAAKRAAEKWYLKRLRPALAAVQPEEMR